MEAPEKVLNSFTKYTPLIDGEIKKLLTRQEKYLMYDMMSYFFGYKNESLMDEEKYGGKRFRPGITLLLSEFYGNIENAIEVASAIEIFHNFTLIHDDIEDNDPIRRGRKTVWKIWGQTQAINTGDAQMILANSLLAEGVEKHNLPVEIITFLNDAFLKIAEGQFLDISMSEMDVDSPEINEDKYIEMIGKKSAVLIAASAKVAGIIAEKNKEECQALWDYGYYLGLAYQLNDDLLSIWGSIEKTGKMEGCDLEERKKTLPVLYLFEKLTGQEKDEFLKIYNSKKPLTHAEISEIKNLLNKSEAHEYVWKKINVYLKESEKAINKLSMETEKKETLIKINKVLIPDIKFWDA